MQTSPREATSHVLNAYSNALKLVLGGQDSAKTNTVVMNLDGHDVIVSVAIDRVAEPVLEANKRLSAELSAAQAALKEADAEHTAKIESLQKQVEDRDKLAAVALELEQKLAAAIADAKGKPTK